MKNQIQSQPFLGEGSEPTLSKPRISVVMAVHNGARYVRLAIESVLSQDFRDFEFIIVDDGSTDETAQIISSYADDRIVYIKNEVNLGQTGSLNVGLSRARAEFVGRIDADDLYLPGKLARQYEVMSSRPEIAVCGTAAVKIDADGKAFGQFVPPIQPKDVVFCLCQRVPVCHVSVLMRRDALVRIGGYDERYRYAADYALWSKLATDGLLITNVVEPLMLYREFTQSLGAVHKLGVAGAESTDIIQANIRAFAGLNLSQEESRAIALLYFPAARLTGSTVASAYLNLSAAARAIYQRTPMRVRLELLAVLCWSLLKQTIRRRTEGAADEESLWTTAVRHVRYPTIPLACLIAACGARLGTGWVSSLKEAVLPLLLRRLR